MKQLYITFKEQTELECTDDGQYVIDSNGRYVRKYITPLGFAAIYDKDNEKTEKKNKAQRIWAYDIWSHVVKDGIVYSIKREWGPQIQGQRECTEIETIARHQPMIVDNDALQCFKVSKTVSRYTTSNKLWRILDPRGFELEISTANMEDILMNGRVDKGEIIGYYVWDFGKNGIGKAQLIKAKP